MNEIGLWEYLNLLLRRVKLIAGITIGVLLIACLALVVMPRTYRGRTSLVFAERPMSQISPQLANLVGSVFQSASMPTFSGREVYISILKSRTLSENVCDNLGLDKLDLDYEDLQRHLEIRTPKEGNLLLIVNAPTSWLRGRVNGGLRRETALLAARIANEYISELTKFDRSNALFLGRKNRIYVESQVRLAKDDLAEAEIRLQEFQQSHPTLIPPDKSYQYSDQIVKLTERETEADVALSESVGQLRSARATWSAGAPKGISPEALIDSPTISGLRTDLSKLEVKRAVLLEDFTEQHPDVVAANRQIEKTRKAIQSEVGRVGAGKVAGITPAQQELLRQIVLLEVAREGLAARKSATDRAISNIESRLARLPAKEIQYARLIRQYKAAESVYLTLLAEHAKARVAEGRDTDGFVVVDRAKPEKKPSSPRVLLTLAASLVIGFMLGVLAASAGDPTPASKR